MSTVVKQRSWPVAVVAGGVLVALLALGGWRAVGDRGASTPGPLTEDTLDDRARDEQADGSGHAPSADADTAPGSGRSSGCDPLVEADRLRQGVDTGGFEPEPSAYRLAVISPAAIRGRPRSTSAADGGTLIELEVTDMIGGTAPGDGRLQTIWTPASEPPTGQLDGEIVAYLSGDTVDADSGQGAGPDPNAELAAVVQLGGMWLGCDGLSPAEPVLVGVEGQPWPVRPSLDDLWRIYTAAASPRPTTLEPTIDAGLAIYDLRFDGGERLRLTLPAEASEPLTLIDDGPNRPVALIGDGLSVEISIAPCTVRSVAADVHWALAQRMVEDGRLVDDVVRVCRPDEHVSMRVDAAELDSIIASSGAGALDSFDLWPIEIGDRSRAVLVSASPELADCPTCAPWGPASHPDAGVVVNRTAPGEVTAVGVDDLLPRWSFDAGRDDVAIRPSADAVLLDVAAGPLLALDPATGEERWRLDRTAGERGEGLIQSSESDGVEDLAGRGGVAWSSFADEGDHRPPTLRWLDIGSGLEEWVATGREGADWQGGDPILVDDVVIVMDVLDPSAEGTGQAGGELQAYGIADGQLRWTLDVGNPPGARSRHVLGLVESPAGQAVIARATGGAVFRVDPATGEQLWRTRFDADRFGGTTRTTGGQVGLLVRTEFGTMVVDLDNGHVIER